MIIIEDTREKDGWDFSIYDSCDGQIQRALKTGDYTVAGYEDDIIIERKHSVTEVANNVGRKAKQFEREFERMLSFRFRFIVCEFTEETTLQFPANANIPKYLKRKVRISGKFIVSRLNKLCEQYGVELYFCNDRCAAEQKAIQLLEEYTKIIDDENNR